MKKAIHSILTTDFLTVILLYAGAFAFTKPTLELPKGNAVLFPWICLGIVYTITTILLLKTLFTKPEKRITYDYTGFSRAMFITAAMLVYILSIVYLGFYIATPIYLYATMFLMGQRKQGVLISVSIVTTVFIYVVFDVLLKLPLPAVGLLLKQLL